LPICHPRRLLGDGGSIRVDSTPTAAKQRLAAAQAPVHEVTALHGASGAAAAAAEQGPPFAIAFGDEGCTCGAE
jgi:hypothetical protein